MADEGGFGIGTYVVVWIVLMVLAGLSLVLSIVGLGAAGPPVALAIGLAKAALILGFFMHLIRQPPVSRWAFALGIALALLLLVFVAGDVLTRTQPLLPTFVPQ